MGEMISLEEAIKAQKALRRAAELGEEQFPVQAFVGMISDEIEALRERGMSDGEIAALIHEHSTIEVTADELAKHYASSAERHGHGG